MANAVLARYGEVFLRKGNRPRFLRMLRDNIRKAVAGNPRLEGVTVRDFYGRYEVVRKDGEELGGAQEAEILATLSKIFGLVSASPAARVGLDYDALSQAAVQLVARCLEERTPDNFRVTASRSYKRFPRNSPEINRDLGATLATEFGLRVDLSNPALVVGVEVHEQGVHVFVDRKKCPGGLPVGASGKGVVLLSGGIDSPVAAWMMGKRGMALSAVHFHSYPYTSQQSIRKVRDLREMLSSWLGEFPLTAIRLTGIQEYFRDRVPPDKLVLFYRRSMVRMAERVARETRCRALITGESLAQVASQTVENIAVIEDASTLPILRPLIGMDKLETIEIARRIGTFETSVQPYDDCCSLFLPRHPDTKGSVGMIRRVESSLVELAELEEEAFSEREALANP